MKKITLSASALIVSLLLSNCYKDLQNIVSDISGRTTAETSVSGVSGQMMAGTAKADVTGPSALVVFMGMADTSQTGKGIQDRTYARAFVFKKGDRKIAYVTADICMIFQGVKQAVVRRLKSEGWSDDNIMLQGTHTHATPAGSSHYLMYNISTMGYVKENFNVQVDGIVRAIRSAEAGLKQTPVTINQDNLFQCGWNRSPRAYIRNPRKELEHYGYVSDLTDLDQEAGFTNPENLDPEEREHGANGLSTGYVDGVDWNNTNKRMTLLKIGDYAMVNWFALHPTTLGALFRYISGDSKGYAEALWERVFPGKVGAFAQANCGDVSGNIKFGPPSKTGIYDWRNTKDLGRRQFEKALQIYNNDNKGEKTLSAVIDYRHAFVDFSNVASTDSSDAWKTAKAAMGGPMSAGSSEDSRSPVPLYSEGTTYDDVQIDGDADTIEKIMSKIAPGLFILMSPDVIEAITAEYRLSQYPKAIIIPNGNLLIPAEDGDTHKSIRTPVTPEVLPVQLLRIGELILCAMPVEVTTMAGRRIENTIKMIFNGDRDGDGWADEQGVINYVVVAQCSNAYAGYLTTREEYQEQYYEGACTQFGPNELKAFQQEIAKLAVSMKNGTAPDKANEPVPRYMNGSVTAELYPGRLEWPAYDIMVTGKPLGGIAKGPYIEKDPDGTRYLKLEIWGGFPNRDLMTEKSYMTVKTPSNPDYRFAPAEYLYTDAAFETRFQWNKGVASPDRVTLWFDLTDQPVTGTYVFTYTTKIKPALYSSKYISKRYSFRIEDAGKENCIVDVGDL